MRFPFLFPVVCFSALSAISIPPLLGDDNDSGDPPGFMIDDSNALGDADYHGCASVWLNFDNLSFQAGDNDEGEHPANDVLELDVHFSSASDASSPYIGYGWQIPLLESCVVSHDDGSVQVLLPTGRPLLMRRAPVAAEGAGAPQGPAFQTEDGAWRASVAGDTFTLTNDQQHWRFVFVQGRIREFKIGDSVPVEWIYKGNYVSEIRLKGSTGKAAFSVTFGKNGRPNGFLMGDAKHRFKLGRVGLFAAERGPAEPNAAPGGDLTLTDWFYDEGNNDDGPLEDDFFAYSMDEEGHATLKFLDPTHNGDERSTALAWDPASRHVVEGGEWRYVVSPGRAPDDPPVITRVNGKGEYEYIAIDRRRGVVTTHLVDGGDTITQFDRMNGIVRPDVYWKISKAGPDGLYHTVTRVDGESGDRALQEMRKLTWDDEGAVGIDEVDEGHLGLGDAAQGGDPGDGGGDPKPAPTPAQTPGPVSAPSAEVFEATERSMLADVEQAAGDFRRNGALEDLARYYIRTGRFDRALALASRTTDRGLQFEIRELVNAADPKTDARQKAETLRRLQTAFPEQAAFIEKMRAWYHDN